MASGGPDIESGSDQVKKCDLCDENHTDGYCCDCEAHMCQSCFDRHLKSKLCRHHTLSAEQNPQKMDPDIFSEDCKFHENLTIKFFCVDHCAVGCAECMLENHSNCKRENIKEAAKKFEMQESGRFLETVQEMKALQDERMTEIKQLSEAVAKSNDKTVNDIEEFKITMTAIVEETVHVALEKAQKVREKNEKAIDQLSRQLEGIGSSLDSFKEKLEHRDNPERLLIDAMEIRPLLEACSEALSSLNTTDSITDFKFQPDENIARIIATSKQLGEVIEEKRKPVCDKQSSKSKSRNKPEQRQKLTKDQIQLAQPPTTQLRNLSTPSNLATSDNGSFFTTPEGIKVRIYMANVVNLDVDCIVRFTDYKLQPKGPVAEAITKAAGQALQGDCQTYLNAHKSLPECQVCSTAAGNLPYKCVIHASVPDFLHSCRSGRSQQFVNNSVQTLLNALLEAERKGMKTIAIPINFYFWHIFSIQLPRAVEEYSSRKQDGRSTTLSEIHFIGTNERQRDALQKAFASRYNQAMV